MPLWLLLLIYGALCFSWLPIFILGWSPVQCVFLNLRVNPSKCSPQKGQKTAFLTSILTMLSYHTPSRRSRFYSKSGWKTSGCKSYLNGKYFQNVKRLLSCKLVLHLPATVALTSCNVFPDGMNSSRGRRRRERSWRRWRRWQEVFFYRSIVACESICLHSLGFIWCWTLSYVWFQLRGVIYKHIKQTHMNFLTTEASLLLDPVYFLTILFLNIL